MAKKLPPDQDPQLREALALDAGAQRALLEILAGHDPRPGNERFRHLPVSIRRTPKGGLSCSGGEFPDDAVLTANSHQLHILIDTWPLRIEDRRAPRAAAAIAALQEAIDFLGPKRGVVSMPFARPRDWTIVTVWDAIMAMVGHIPSSPSDTGEFHARVSDPVGVRNYAKIEVTPYSQGCESLKDSPFCAEVRLHKDACGAIRERREFFNDDFVGPLRGVGQHVQRWKDAQAIRGPAAPVPSSGFTADRDDDDDLDAFERAARLALHGSRGVPKGAPSTQDPEIEALVRQMLAAAAIKPHVLKVIHIYTAEVIEGRGHAL